MIHRLKKAEYILRMLTDMNLNQEHLKKLSDDYFASGNKLTLKDLQYRYCVGCRVYNAIRVYLRWKGYKVDTDFDIFYILKRELPYIRHGAGIGVKTKNLIESILNAHEVYHKMERNK